MSTGFRTRFGLAREASGAVWPSSVPALVTALLGVKSEGLADTAQLAVVQTRSTRGAATHAHVVARAAEAPWSADVVYEGMELLWALALGFQAKRIGGVVFPEELAAPPDPVSDESGLLGSGRVLGDGLLLGGTGGGAAALLGSGHVLGDGILLGSAGEGGGPPAPAAPGAYRHRFEIDVRLQGEPWKLGDGFLLGSEIFLGQRSAPIGEASAPGKHSVLC